MNTRIVHTIPGGWVSCGRPYTVGALGGERRKRRRNQITDHSESYKTTAYCETEQFEQHNTGTRVLTLYLGSMLPCTYMLLVRLLHLQYPGRAFTLHVTYFFSTPSCWPEHW